MSRNEKLLTLILRAQANGFEFKPWFQTHIDPDWPGENQAVALLAKQGRLFALIFSHEFARAFWKCGEQMRFAVPAGSYSRVNGKGQVITINRKPFTRRTIKPDVWQYHLRQMVLSNDPVAYLNRFLPSESEIVAQTPAVEGLIAAS